MNRRGMVEPKHQFNTPSRPEGGNNRTGARLTKRSVNLSIDADILEAARGMNLNLSNILEQTLRQLTEDERIRVWRANNKDVIESYNAYIERNGVLGEELLEFDEPSV